MKSASRQHHLSTLLDLLLILAACYVICFSNLNSPSIGFRDESKHVRAIQEMRATNSWIPSVDGEPYFNKPPFKMWLSFIPLHFFGESAFSYRFIDAAAGLGTCLLIYFFSRVVFLSRLAGLIAVFTLLGSYSYIFVHGVRHAVQDSLLVFLNTLAFFPGYLLIDKLKHKRSQYDQKSPTVLVITCGLALGLGALTKNVAGFIPLAVAAFYLLLSGNLGKILSSSRRESLMVLLLAVLPLAAYLIPNCLTNDVACGTLLHNEVYLRTTEGYHNQDQPWFYLIRLFSDRQAAPPEILVPAILFLVFQSISANSPKHFFLLIWIILPVLIFSLIPSRLTWYIAPTFPGMALACGLLLAELGERAKKSLILLPIFLISLLPLVYNIKNVVSDVFSPEPRLVTDLVLSDILNYSQVYPEHSKIISFNAPDFALHEKAYGGMIRNMLTPAASAEELLEKRADKKNIFVLTNLEGFSYFLENQEVIAYRYLPPLYDRKNWMAALILKPETEKQTEIVLAHTPNFYKAKRFIDFKWRSNQEAFGFGGPGHTLNAQADQLIGQKFGVSFIGDLAFRKFGASLNINISSRREQAIDISLFVNDQKIASKSLAPGDFRSLIFQLPGGTIIDGQNMFTFVVHDNIAEDEQSKVFVNWLSVNLKMQGSK